MPCARSLYEWLLQRMPAGKQQEFEIDDFSTESGYSPRQISRAIERLKNLGLIEVLKRYTWKVWKLIAVHPETSMSENVTGMSEIVTEMSQIGHSNPDSTVPINRENREQQTQTVCDLKTVSQDQELDRGLSTNTTPSQSRPVQPQNIGVDQPSAATRDRRIEIIEQAIEKPIAPALKSLALVATMQVIEAAIAVLEEAKTSRKGVEDETAFLIRAIQQEWKPRKCPGIVSSALKTFGEWFKWAKSNGYAVASMGEGNRIRVMTSDGWMYFEQAIERFPSP